jgi:hypothetical protein
MAHTYLKIYLKELADFVCPAAKQVGLAGSVSDCILEIPGSNLNQDTHDPNLFLFSSVSPGKCEYSTSDLAMTT